jgi:hypothetical protein
MKKLQWVKNTKTNAQAWVVDICEGWDKIEVMTLSGKTYWKKSNVVAI